MQSKRKDGRGHWPAGKRRSPLSERDRSVVARRLEQAIKPDAVGSIKAVARVLKVSDRTIRRILSGDDFPSRRILNLVRAKLPVRG